MTSSNGDRLLHEVEGSDFPDQEIGEAMKAYEKIEALFELLRLPANAAPSEATDVPGKVLGEFVILRPLASGGMGHVYLARQESLGRMVALKVCKPEIARDPRTKSRFMAEALSLAKLAHPNVVPVLTIGEEQGSLYLAMEYVAGPTLAQVLQAVQGARPDSLASEVVAQVLADPDEEKDQLRRCTEGHAKLDRTYQTWVAQMLQQVAQGLAAAHAAGILHRDIKPANIVFAANGVPKIVDFGLARSSQAPSTTVAGEFYGTPAYTSPEQARGEVDEVSPASDVFSFGATLFECLSLDRPFPGRTSADVLSAVLNSEAPLLRRVKRGTPWELEAIADKCLRKSPSERYPSAGSLAQDLQNYLELRPVSARPIGKLGRVGRAIRRRPWIAASFVSIAIASVVSLVFAGQAWEEVKAEKVRSANQEQELAKKSEVEKVRSTKQEQELAKKAAAEFEAEKVKTIAKRVDEGDAALFRGQVGQRPTWLPAVIEKHRQAGIEAYSAALNLDPHALRPLVQRARLYASKKETLAHALADLDKARQLKPDFASIHKFRGIVLDELGRKDEAQAAREEAKRHYPTAAEDLYWLGVIAHSAEQDFFACHTLFSQALLLAPNDYWSRLERALFGRVAAEENVRQRVIPELEIAKSMRPDLPFASELLVRFFEGDQAHGYGVDPLRQQKELTDQIDRFGLDIFRAHKMSELLQKDKKLNEAEVMLRKVLDQDRGGVTAEQLGDLEYRRGNYEAARDWYRRAIREGTKHPYVYLHLADSFTALKQWKGAETAYLDGIAQHPSRPFLYASLGKWYEQRDRDEDAEKAYRKGCELPCDFQGSSPSLAESSGQVRDLASCFRSLAHLVGKSERIAERLQVLERGIAKLEKALASINQAQKESVEEHIFKLKEDLGQAYLIVGSRKDALAIIDSELKRRPLDIHRAGALVRLLRLHGLEQEALAAARRAEFTIQQQSPSSNDTTQRHIARALVDGQLQRLQQYKELFDRLETRRALGEALTVEEYGWFIFSRGPEAATILGEGVKKHPDSVLLHSHHMQVLAKADRKEEAWKAYEKGRDLYFAQVGRSQIPALPVASQAVELPPISPLALALPWYTFLLQEGKEEEFGRLEDRLQKACLATRSDPKGLALSRATAEFTTRRFAAAAKSFRICVQEKLWNQGASEAMVTAGLARSLRFSGQGKDAIEVYKRAVQVSGAHPSLFSEYLYLAVEEDGFDGLLRELSTFDLKQIGTDVRRHATMSCFMAWVSLPMGKEKAAREYLAQGAIYVQQASLNPEFNGDEGLVCSVILQIVAERLGTSNRVAFTTQLLDRYPAERVRAMRKILTLPNRKENST